jgi:MFS transporter, ACS family, hexuronate transporter
MIGTEGKLEATMEPPALRGRWTICAMLFVATTINYVDRQVLSILAPILHGTVLHLQPFFPGWHTTERTLNLSEVQYGNIVWAFQVAYALGVIFAGRLIDRLGCRRGYAIVTGVWSVAAMSHSLVNTVGELGFARFMLGLGESGNFPAAVKAVAEWFPPRERALATGLFNSGTCVGAILAPFMVPWVVLHFGWRTSFLVTGVFSAAWIVWWSIRYRRPRVAAGEPRTEAAVARPARSLAWWKLLGYRQTWAFMTAKFLTDPVWWFFLFWLPKYFSFRFKLDLAHIGLPLVVIYLSSSVGSIFGGWLPRLYLRTGMQLKPARLTAMFTCACFVVPIATVGLIHSEWIVVGLISLATAAHQGWSANVFTTSSDMFPSETVGTVVSFGQVGGAVGGAILALVAGHLLELVHTYVPLFVYSGCAYLLALAMVLTLAPGLKRARLDA